MFTLEYNLAMKKSKPITKAQDRPNPAQLITPDNEKPDLLPVAPFYISRERLMEGTSTTTDVLSEILKRHKETALTRHWGLNE